MIFYDEEALPTETTFDSRLCGLLSAIADGRQGDAQLLLRRVRAGALGLSAVSRLIRAGMNRYAVALLGNDYIRLKQALGVELGILDGEIAPENKEIVFKEALLQNRVKLAFSCANPEQKAFLNALCGSAEPIDYEGATI